MVEILRRRAKSKTAWFCRWPGAVHLASKGAVFGFAFFPFALLPPAPFNPPYCRSTLNFPHSLLIT
jgi:hypothetical protein